MPRPPMISGTPSRRPQSIAGFDSGAVAMATTAPDIAPPPAFDPPAPPAFAPAIAARTDAAVAEVAQGAGIDPGSPEMAAISKLSREVVERVVWEVVPERAEAIIREHIAKNGLPR